MSITYLLFFQLHFFLNISVLSTLYSKFKYRFYFYSCSGIFNFIEIFIFYAVKNPKQAILELLNSQVLSRLGFNEDSEKCIKKSISCFNNDTMISNLLKLEKNINLKNTQKIKKYAISLLEDKSYSLIALNALISLAISELDIVELKRLLDKSDEIFPSDEYFISAKFELDEIDKNWENMINHINVSKNKKIDIIQNSQYKYNISHIALSIQKYNKGNFVEAKDILSKIKDDILPKGIVEANILCKLGNHKKARQIIEKYYKNTPNFELSNKYFSLCNGKKELLDAAMKLYQINPENYISCKMVAKYAIENQNYSLAKNFLDKALLYNQTKEVYLMLIELKSFLGEDIKELIMDLYNVESEKYYNCKFCNAEIKKWHHICNFCGKFGCI